MHANANANLHCGCVDIGHAHERRHDRVLAQCTHRRSCSVSERSRAAFLGHGLQRDALLTCKKAARPAQRGAVQTRAVFGFLRGDAAEQTRKKYQAKVDAINRLEPQMQSLSDQDLANKTQELKRRAQEGGIDDLLVEAFAVSRCFGLFGTDASMRNAHKELHAPAARMQSCGTPC